MEKLLRNIAGLFQILFYIFAMLAFIAFVFYFFGTTVRFRTVGMMLVATFLSYIIYFITYRVYANVYKKEEFKSIPEHLDELEK